MNALQVAYFSERRTGLVSERRAQTLNTHRREQLLWFDNCRKMSAPSSLQGEIPLGHARVSRPAMADSPPVRPGGQMCRSSVACVNR